MASQNQNAVSAGSSGTTVNGPPGPTVAAAPVNVSAATAVGSTQSVTSTKVQSQSVTLSAQSQQQQQSQPNNIELDKSTSNTLKRNPKMEWNKTDLLKIMGYLEAELQAREIVIAALKSEKMKHLVSSRYLSGTADPHAALARDGAIAGGAIGPDGAQIDQQYASLETLISQQRRMQSRMAKVLRDAEIRHRAVINELEEERRKHEHDTAQGDDITYGLEKERTRLRKELELEKQEKKRLEAELKKVNDILEEEKSRQKHIVLLLLVERKKIFMKYIEERKRSEDLAQILSEEKVRIDSMAEGLEEESKKSLQMEAELEKQLAQFDIERQQYKQALAREEQKSREMSEELDKLRIEMETFKESLIRNPQRILGSTPPPPPAKPPNLVAMPTLRPATAPQTIKGAVLGTGTPMVSSKVVQPTATVSSVPVSGPTTGIARSVTPGQALRGAYTSNVPATGTESTAPSEAQGAEKRAVIAAAANPTGAAKVTPTTQPAGKLGFHANAASATSQAPTAALPSKKPTVSRGVPPPVPPNKPVVPPKKEAAYLRRSELPQSAQDTIKFVKQSSIHSAPHSNVQPPPLQPQQSLPANIQAPEDEMKPR